MIDRLALTMSTWFGCGLAPIAPGTVGAAAAVFIALLLVTKAGAPPWAFAALAALLLPLAIWSAGVTARIRGVADPGMVVIDEVVGQWLTLAGARYFNWESWLAAFCLFRIFDIWKPWPVRQLERMPGGAGIVFDDVMAGLYAALVLFLLGCFNLY